MKSNLKSGCHTCLLCPTKWLALLCPAHCEDVDQVVSVWGESCQGEVVSGGGKSLVLGPATADHLVSDTVTSDFALGSEPVDGKGVGEDFREAQVNWGIQS